MIIQHGNGVAVGDGYDLAGESLGTCGRGEREAKDEDGQLDGLIPYLISWSCGAQRLSIASAF